MKTASSLLLISTALLDLAASVCGAGELLLKVVDKEPPKEIGESIRQTLQSKAVQVLETGKPIYEFWFCKEIPLKTKPESQALAAVAETTLIGVVAVESGQRDYKDNEIPQGIYTARFGLQPQDGDHLGTAEYSYFAVLIPAKNDTQLSGISSYRAMVKASGKETPSGHPIVLSLRPVPAEESESPKLNEPAPDHKSVRLKLVTKLPAADQKASIAFELVYRGKGKI